MRVNIGLGLSVRSAPGAAPEPTCNAKRRFKICSGYIYIELLFPDGAEMPSMWRMADTFAEISCNFAADYDTAPVL